MSWNFVFSYLDLLSYLLKYPLQIYRVIFFLSCFVVGKVLFNNLFSERKKAVFFKKLFFLLLYTQVHYWDHIIIMIGVSIFHYQYLICNI